ncbi:sulfotransferase family 2 domain-containing protein [Marinobacter pelagius]|uniref:Sulfotransferase family protein n=1 Tax=Marinobacter pelagius TaxID=379482 RepID=A0A1I4U1F4_9GAMM|nr:sulfotransferase family 2 domain-containing protein [Marinobacter pelagius]SFM82651.1 Sulfotransferase family protein [Marinobacter pelagius]
MISFRSFKERLNIYRRYPHWSHLNCIFVHVPKAAGTSVNKALYGRTLGHYSAAEIQRTFPNLYGRAFTFSLVRNPWDRVLSAYRFACVGRTDSMGVHKPEQYRIPEFESFERFLCEWLPKQDVEKLDYIFRPQWMFVCDDSGEVMVDHLGRVEALDETVDVLGQKLGKPILINNENSTGSPKRDFRNAYTRPEMVEVVRAIYLRDIELFGYEFERMSAST